MALAQKTEILLLDEPTTYLDDMAHQLEVLQIVEKFNKEDNLSQQEVYKEAVLSNWKVRFVKRIIHQMIFPNQLIQTNTSNSSGMVSIWIL